MNGWRKRGIANAGPVRKTLPLYAGLAVHTLAPLIYIPYLVRVIGPSHYGLITFAQSLIFYLILILDYGKSLTLPRDVAVLRSDPASLGYLLSNLVTARFLIAFLLAAAALALGSLLPAFAEDATVLYLTFGLVIAAILPSPLIAQGLERYSTFALVSIASKAALVLSVFLLIRSERDFILFPALVSLVEITSGIVLGYILLRRTGIRLVFPGISGGIAFLRSEWRMFASSLGISAYTQAPTVLLGMAELPAVVGWYSGGEKIIRSTQSLINPVFQVYYPLISREARRDPVQTRRLVLRILVRLSAAGFILSSLLFLLAPVIVSLILGPDFDESVLVVRILSALPFIKTVSVTCANLHMLAFGQTRRWSRMINIVSLIAVGVTVALVLILKWGIVGASVSLLLPEAIVAVTSLYAILKPGKGEILTSREFDAA